MAWKPRSKDSWKTGNFSFGPIGVADVLISKERGIVAVKIRESEYNGKVTPAVSAVIPFEDAPEYLQNKDKKKVTALVSLTEERDKIVYFVPCNTKLVCSGPPEFVKDREENLIPFTKGTVNRFNKDKPPQEYFKVRYTATEGEWEGVRVTHTLPYNICEWDDHEIEGFKSSTFDYSKSPHNEKGHTRFLHAFLKMIGVYKGDPLPYRDNMLPLFEKVANRHLSNEKIEVVTTDRGQIATVLKIKDFEDEIGDLIDDEFDGIIDPEVIEDDDEFFGVDEDELDFEPEEKDDTPDFDETFDEDDE